MGLFGKPKIEGDELKRCLAYFEAESRVTAFQTREADIYNNTLVKYLDSIAKDQSAAREVHNAANRLLRAAHEVMRRHKAIESVPDAASAMRYAWHITFLAYASWAEAAASGTEAMAKGMTPQYRYVQQLLNEHQTAWRRADEEDKKFLKKLKVTANDIADIVTRSTDAGSADSWRPSQ